MKALVLKVAGKNVGRLSVDNVLGLSSYDPYRLSAGGFVVDMTLDQARQLADLVTRDERPAEKVELALARMNRAATHA